MLYVRFLKYTLGTCLLVLPMLVSGQAAKMILIRTAHTALVFDQDEQGRLRQRYFGPALAQAAEYTQVRPGVSTAYPTAGTDNLFSPAIRTVHADGNPSLELVYQSHAQQAATAGVTETVIQLKDPQYPFEVKLHLKAYHDEDVIGQWVEIRHTERKPLTLYQYASAALQLNARDYWLQHFHGDWAAEMQEEEVPLSAGIKTIESRLGTRAHMYQSPSFLVSLDAPAGEESGEVLGGTLAWSGNFRFAFEIDEQHHLRLIGGMHPEAAEYQLGSGETFTTPMFLYSYSTSGKGVISRNFHRWARKYGVLNGNGDRYTLLNNWEATYFDFNEQQLTHLFDDAKDLGVDLFLLDDGWFANKYPRNSDKAGLGDWQENKKKLPHGLGYLVEQAAQKGLRFGIWLEPEMVNPKSELYEQHPDWVIKLPNRPEHYFRQQLVLDLSNPKVQDFVYHIVDDMMTKYPGIAYIKWDCNRMITHAYSPYLKQQQSHLYVAYTRGLYEVLAKLRKKYPTLPVMLCSGGGGRVDYGALPYFTEFWPSDNTGAVARIFIQWGYSYFFPAIATSAHVTTMGDAPLAFRLAVSMSGKLGFDLVPQHMKPEELALCRQALKEYAEIKHTVWQGDQYRLWSPYEGDKAAWMYVDSTGAKAVVFAYQYAQQFRNKNVLPLRLKGLDAAARYRVRELLVLPGKQPLSAASGRSYSGDYLMKVGVPTGLNGAYKQAVLVLEKE